MSYGKLKPATVNLRSPGFTLVELLVVITIMANRAQHFFLLVQNRRGPAGPQSCANARSCSPSKRVLAMSLTNTGEPRNAAVPQLPAFGPWPRPSIALTYSAGNDGAARAADESRPRPATGLKPALRRLRLKAAKQMCPACPAAVSALAIICSVSLCSRVRASCRLQLLHFCALPRRQDVPQDEKQHHGGERHERPAFVGFQLHQPLWLRDGVAPAACSENKIQRAPRRGRITGSSGAPSRWISRLMRMELTSKVSFKCRGFSNLRAAEKASNSPCAAAFRLKSPPVLHG